MKAVLRSIKPYWVYLIITGRKTVEVGKTAPKSSDWNKVVEIYCSKDIRSFARIPRKHRAWFSKYLGKVVGRFICDELGTAYWADVTDQNESNEGYIMPCLGEECLSAEELYAYGKGDNLFLYHISDLKIYDKPKELSEFKRWNRTEENSPCANTKWLFGECKTCKACNLTRPPQSWCYVED